MCKSILFCNSWKFGLALKILAEPNTRYTDDPITGQVWFSNVRKLSNQKNYVFLATGNQRISLFYGIF